MPRINLVNCCFMLSLQELALNAALVTAKLTSLCCSSSLKPGWHCKMPPSTSPYRCSSCTGSQRSMPAWQCMNAASFS